MAESTSLIYCKKNFVELLANSVDNFKRTVQIVESILSPEVQTKNR